MEQKFKEYLEKEFRMIKPTEEAMEYRMEVLQNLLDRAQEYKIKGMTDEDAIYNLCIDSLGDFKSTLTSFQNKLDSVKRSASMVGATFLFGIVFALILVAGYLVISFATGAWAKTWLILVGGIFIALIALSVALIIRCAKKKKYLPIRGFSQIIIILTFVFVFLMVTILSDMGKSWMLFLVMIVVDAWVDTALAFVTNSKSKILMSMLSVILSSVMAYLGLGILGGYWHPYWLIIIAGVIISIIILASYLMKYATKKAKAEQEEKIKQDEAFYTNWNK